MSCQWLNQGSEYKGHSVSSPITHCKLFARVGYASKIALYKLDPEVGTVEFQTVVRDRYLARMI